MSDAPSTVSHFIRTQIEKDLAQARFASRRWAGQPGSASSHQAGEPESAAIRTRFPPEPNGYLHIGHAKAICLNFGLAADFNGRCHLRFDDTNPLKENQEYVDSIIDSVHWLGFDWARDGESNLYFASDYFDWLYEFAERLIEAGHAYVDSQDAEQMRANRGTLTEPGRASIYRDRDATENMRLFREMRDGRHPDGAHVLRARIDMASPNINLRDPALYRIRRAHHHRSGEKWCIYPMYDYAHPVGDALENITHSLCTLEFEDHRPVYDWVLEKLAALGIFDAPLPRQIEFARLNLSFTITSKRKLQELVTGGHVQGWDDPRMPTLVGMRRRGYTAAAIRDFCERIGVTKADAWIDMSLLEQTLREDLEDSAPRATAVLDPLRLIIDNWPADTLDSGSAPIHPAHPERGQRMLPFSGELWIEREDFEETPPKGFRRLFPGNRVRLRYGYVIECTGCDKDADGRINTVHAQLMPDSKSGTPGADNYKVKGAIHCLSIAEAIAAEVRLYDRLFTEAQPDAGGRDYLDSLNPDSVRVVQAFVEPGLAGLAPDTRVQFERHGYFVSDRLDSSAERLVFNRAVTLKDSWARARK